MDSVIEEELVEKIRSIEHMMNRPYYDGHKHWICNQCKRWYYGNIDEADDEKQKYRKCHSCWMRYSYGTRNYCCWMSGSDVCDIKWECKNDRQYPQPLMNTTEID